MMKQDGNSDKWSWPVCLIRNHINFSGYPSDLNPLGTRALNTPHSPLLPYVGQTALPVLINWGSIKNDHFLPITDIDHILSHRLILSLPNPRLEYEEQGPYRKYEFLFTHHLISKYDYL